MPQRLQQKANIQFNKGLITEAGELTFPPDASVDEINCDLEQDGSRRRRLGVEYETSHVLSTHTVTSTDTVTTRTWSNVGGESGTEFLIVQINANLYFYNKTGDTISDNQIDTTYTSGTPYVVDLTTYARPAGLGAARAKVDVTSINGALIVASSEINTFYIERDLDDGSFTETEINFRVRDFVWQGDTSTYYEDSDSNPPSIERQYDTLNVGWVGRNSSGFGGGDALDTYIGVGFFGQNAWPPLTMPWYAGKNSVGQFSALEWHKTFYGTNLAANGHFILDFYFKDREAASELVGVASSTEEGRFSTVATYAGRVFYSGITTSTDSNNSKIYFSQLLVSDLTEVGDIFQKNDPTSEYFSDLLDTDGGFINIPEAYNIKKLHVFGPTLYAFAENGVWAISGVDDVFRATDYSVSKLTEIGLVYPNSFVSALGRPYWWSAVGIHTLVSGEINAVIEENLSRTTIQTFWENIDSDSKDKAEGIYDPLENRVLWMYPNDNETNENKYNKILFFDEALAAFFPWTISDNVAGSYVAGASVYTGVGIGEVTFQIVDSDSNEVVDSSSNTMEVTRNTRQFASSAIKFLCIDGTSSKITFGQFTNTDFLDWGSANYDSYVESAYDFLGDIHTRKNAPYITPYFRVTETGWEDAGSGNYTPVRESSCLVSFIWDFKDTPSSTPQQGYRLKKLPVVDPLSLNTFGYEFSTVSTRLKLRGRGQSMRVKFESEQGKDFHLLGYEIIGAKNDRF